MPLPFYLSTRQRRKKATLYTVPQYTSYGSFYTQLTEINTQTFSPNKGMLIVSPKGSESFLASWQLCLCGVLSHSVLMCEQQHVAVRACLVQTETLGHLSVLSFSDYLLKGGVAGLEWMMGLLRNCCLWPWGSKEQGQPTFMWVALQVDHLVPVTAALAGGLTKSSWGRCSWIPGL